MSMPNAMPAYPPHAHSLYDLQEQLEQFRTRQGQAFAAGRRAWRERLIKAHLLPFYEALVAYVGQNQDAWVKEQTLAAEFSVQIATIKRWLAALETAGVIRRQRRFATSSLTFLTAYDPSEQAHALVTAPRAARSREYEVINGSTNVPTLGAYMHQDSIKSEILTSVGGTQAHSQTPVAPEVQQILAREGVTDYTPVPTIQQKPFAELQAISGYLSRQRHVHDRPRLFAWLASRDFGAQLLQGRRSGAEQQPRVDPPRVGGWRALLTRARRSRSARGVVNIRIAI